MHCISLLIILAVMWLPGSDSESQKLHNDVAAKPESRGNANQGDQSTEQKSNSKRPKLRQRDRNNPAIADNVFDNRSADYEGESALELVKRRNGAARKRKQRRVKEGDCEDTNE